MGKYHTTSVRLLGLKDKIKPYLAETGMSVSELIRAAVENYLELNPERVKSSDLMLDELKSLQSSMSRVGGNLNQLAYHFNTTDEVDDYKLATSHEELRLEFKKVMQFLNKVNYK